MAEKSKFRKAGLIALSVMFSALAAAPAVFAQDASNDMKGTWQNDDIGVVEIAPCADNQSKFCGYLLEASPEAIEEFQLRVDKTSQSVRGLMVISDLIPNEEGTKFQEGRFQNTDSSRAQSATLTVKLDGEALNVRASVGWFGEDFKFSRVVEDRQILVNATARPPPPKNSS